MNEHTNPPNPNQPSVDRLSLLWRRVNDHKIVQWSVAYIALAYGVQHGVELTSDAFEWPHAVVRVSMLLLVLGLPLVMTVAWYHGERASLRISGPELTIISILLVMSSLLFYVFVRPSAELAAPAAQQAGVEAARAASASVGNAISIAVLPFENLTADPDQEFFSAGMTEEITSALAKIPDLRVVGRTSAFQFKGKNQDLRAIGQALNATHLIEGSVRRAGTRVRITAELIRADNGLSIWTDSYDRELADVFAIQEDIATAIAGALRMPLGLKPGEHLVNNRTNDLKAYEDFLRVRVVGALARQVPNARAILEEAVARDPNFAPAWASLANQYVAFSNPATRQAGPVEEVRRVTQSWLDKAEMAARKATELDSRLASGFGQLALVQTRRGKWSDAERLFAQALTLDPDDPETLQAYGLHLENIGHLKDALRARENLLRVEPFVPIYNDLASLTLHLNGQDARAIVILEAQRGNNGNYNRNYALATVYATQGQYTKAVDTLLLINGQIPHQAVEEAAKLLRTAPAKAQVPQDLPILQAELNFVYAHVGALDRVIEYPERVHKIGNMANGFALIWDPLYAPVRKTERFKMLMRDAGLVDYWKARGWPDLCRPVGADDFVCD